MQSALTRYRALAYATGVFLLLLTAHVIVQFVQSRSPGVSFGQAKGLGSILPGGQTWIPITHGYLYLVYVVLAVDLWFRTRLPISRTILVVLAGTIPFMSFVAERWVRARVTPMIEAERARRPASQVAPRQ